MGPLLPAFQKPFRLARNLIGSKDRRYWLIAMLIVASSVVVTPYVDQNIEQATGVKYLFFHLLTAIDPRHPEPARTALIFVDEETHRALGNRVPLKRDHLTAVLKALDDDSIDLVALDFNLRAIDYNAPLHVGDFRPVGEYRAETDAFIREIISFAARHTIILGKTLWAGKPQSDQSVHALLDIYQPYGICVTPLQDGAWFNPGSAGFPIGPAAAKNIRCGYLNPPQDMRQLPTPLSADDGNPIDSFSVAIVRAIEPGALAKIADVAIFSGYFRERAVLAQQTFTTGQLIDPVRRAAIWDKLKHRIVIVGGHWKIDAGDDDFVDMHDTPLGSISGTIIHQNFVEAMLDHRLYESFGGTLLEVFFAISAAFVFAASTSVRSKIGLLLAGGVGLLLIQWLVFYLGNLFFDALVAVAGLGVHSIIEQVFEPRHDAGAHH